MAARVDLLETRPRRSLRIRIGPANLDDVHADAVQRELRELRGRIVEALAELLEPLWRHIGRRLELTRRIRPRRRVRPRVSDRQPFVDSRDGDRDPVVAGRQADFHLDGLAAEILPIVGKRRRALLIVGGGLHQLLVNPERDRDRFGRFRAQPPEHDADDVFAVDGNAVHRVECVGKAQPGDVVGGRNRHLIHDFAALRAQPRQRRFHRRRSEHRDPRHAIRGRHVLFHEHRRERQHVGNVVESVAGIVLREVVGRAQVNAKEFFDGVVVFGAVQASRGDPAGIERSRRVNAFELPCQPRRHRLTLLFRRLLFLERRHFAAAKLADDLVPLLAMRDEGRAGVKRLQVEIVLLLLVAVAGKAVLREERLDDGVEARARPRGRRSGLRGRPGRLLGGAHDHHRRE